MEHEIARLVRSLPRSPRRGAAPEDGRRQRHRWSGSRVQVLLFDTSKWTQRDARSWARRHGFEAKKVHRTEHYIRLRQFDPTPGAPKRTISFGRGGADDTGIRAVVEAY